MRLRNIRGSEEYIEQCDYVIKLPETMKGNWKSVFPNDAPLHIEVGMGKGQFLIQMAKAHPDVNYVGIERYSSVLLRALQKLEDEDIKNIRFLSIDAAALPEIFDTEEVDKIYLNFSDPWPKDRHAKRRLTSHQFLERYDQILKKDGLLEFKTDNQVLFDFSLEEVAQSKWQLKECTRDLHHDDRLNKGNIMTEYEQKFSEKGNPIYKMIICR